MKLFNDTITTLEHALNYASKRNKVISNNIANVDTPHYKAKDVSFQSHLNKAISTQIQAKRTDPRHFHFTNDLKDNTIYTKRDTTYNHNGNNVDIDKEMANLAQNQIYYRSLVDNLNAKFTGLRNVIRGGR